MPLLVLLVYHKYIRSIFIANEHSGSQICSEIFVQSVHDLKAHFQIHLLRRVIVVGMQDQQIRRMRRFDMAEQTGRRVPAPIRLIHDQTVYACDVVCAEAVAGGDQPIFEICPVIVERSVQPSDISSGEVFAVERSEVLHVELFQL